MKTSFVEVVLDIFFFNFFWSSKWVDLQVLESFALFNSYYISILYFFTHLPTTKTSLQLYLFAYAALT